MLLDMILDAVVVMYVVGVSVYLIRKLEQLKSDTNKALVAATKLRIIRPDNVVVVEGNMKECRVKTNLVLVQTSSAMIMNNTLLSDSESEGYALEMQEIPKVGKEEAL